MKFNNKVKFMQEGGAVAAPAEPETAPAGSEGAAPAEGQDPLAMLAQMAAQALQNNDGQMALQVCKAFLQLIQQMANEQGSAPAAPQGEPVYAKGGKIAYRINQ